MPASKLTLRQARQAKAGFVKPHGAFVRAPRQGHGAACGCCGCKPSFVAQVSPTSLLAPQRVAAAAAHNLQLDVTHIAL